MNMNIYSHPWNNVFLGQNFEFFQGSNLIFFAKFFLNFTKISIQKMKTCYHENHNEHLLGPSFIATRKKMTTS
jgi:hypothetical protein